MSAHGRLLAIPWSVRTRSRGFFVRWPRRSASGRQRKILVSGAVRLRQLIQMTPGAPTRPGEKRYQQSSGSQGQSRGSSIGILIAYKRLSRGSVGTSHGASPRYFEQRLLRSQYADLFSKRQTFQVRNACPHVQALVLSVDSYQQVLITRIATVPCLEAKQRPIFVCETFPTGDVLLPDEQTSDAPKCQKQDGDGRDADYVFNAGFHGTHSA